jgi:hypothetical protein
VPAAAVIPAPVAYIKVAAVKKLVVGCVVDDNNHNNHRNLSFAIIPLIL